MAKRNRDRRIIRHSIYNRTRPMVEYPPPPYIPLDQRRRRYAYHRRSMFDWASDYPLAQYSGYDSHIREYDRHEANQYIRLMHRLPDEVQDRVFNYYHRSREL